MKTNMKPWVPVWHCNCCASYCNIVKTHVHGFFDYDLREVISSTDRMKIRVKEHIQNCILFLSLGHLIPSKLSRKRVICSRQSPWLHIVLVHSQVCAIGHCVISQGADLLWPDWLNWWVWPWVPALKIQIFLTPQNPGTQGQVWIDTNVQQWVWTNRN